MIRLLVTFLALFAAALVAICYVRSGSNAPSGGDLSQPEEVPALASVPVQTLPRRSATDALAGPASSPELSAPLPDSSPVAAGEPVEPEARDRSHDEENASKPSARELRVADPGRFLEETKLPDDVAKVVHDARPLRSSPQLIPLVNGVYAGSARFSDGRVFSVSMTMRGELNQKGGLRGSQEIVLTDASGKVYSRSKGKGPLDATTKVVPGAVDGVIVGSEELYFQLYPAEDSSEELIGSIYDPVDEMHRAYHRVGTLRVVRHAE